ncbi:hypothetical protein Slip_1507 [Syntrophothermus lipocalidus DSM 12680]|uniref:Uncharacterized protein n=1 Tax=Syntrophothermus lipocalidus (strain DSM 12680 / TGB-C1) TaxID=643648 RepID=D7CNI5_SYNLT|nr:hypothetical protein Slip_1507 [Syntrophothermus lipocalidus DSM 12680]
MFGNVGPWELILILVKQTLRKSNRSIHETSFKGHLRR